MVGNPFEGGSRRLGEAKQKIQPKTLGMGLSIELPLGGASKGIGKGLRDFEQHDASGDSTLPNGGRGTCYTKHEYIALFNKWKITGQFKF